MVQGYYTLQEAAQALGMSPEDLKQMAQRNQIRSFQDRGTWRFRVQDIQELARQRGAASDLELVLGDSGAPKSADSPVPKPKSNPPRKSGLGPKTPTKAAQPEVFDFALGDTPSSHKPKPDSKKGGPPAPAPQHGSDSDVRLVPENSDLDFVFDRPATAGDSNVKLASDSAPKKSGASPRPHTPPRKSGLSLGRKSGLGADAPKTPKTPSKPVADSGVRLVPMDSDSDVRIVGADEISLQDELRGAPGISSPTDSDIRLEPASSRPPTGQEGLLTEEINLDEELRKQEAQRHQTPQAKLKPKSKLPKFPSVSPFDLSESQLRLPPDSKKGKSASKPDSSDFDLAPAPKPDSSDFDLATSPKADSSDFDLGPASVGDSSSDDFSLELPDDADIHLGPGASGGELKGPSSGISLNNPADSGISLEQGSEASDEIEFELNLDAQATPRPAGHAKAAKGEGGESSEFELSLDAGDAGVDSSSEFELTLDDSGGLAPLEEDKPQVKAGAEDKDIFETDFEVPALEEESGSQVAALDSGLDSSDFDLALGDSDIGVDDESGSAVVALDEEEVDEGAATVAAQPEEFEEIVEEDETAGFEQLEEEVGADTGPTRVVVREKILKTAPWGALPVVLMLPCVVLVFLVGIMGFELVSHMGGYQPPGFLTKAISELMGQKPK